MYSTKEVNVGSTQERVAGSRPTRVQDNEDGVSNTTSRPSSPDFNFGESWLSGLSKWVTQNMEEAFDRHGQKVATYPLQTVIICVLITALCSIGSLWFTTELRPYRLWIPQHSEFIKVLDWQAQNFPSSYRQHMVIYEADNILSADNIKEMWRLHKRINGFRVNGKGWEDVCARVPSMPTTQEEPDLSDYEDFEFGSLRRKRDTIMQNYESTIQKRDARLMENVETSIEKRSTIQKRDAKMMKNSDSSIQKTDMLKSNLGETFEALHDSQQRAKRGAFQTETDDLSLTLPRNAYCDNLVSLPRLCLETSLLEIWGLDEDRIMSLTDSQVIDDFNDAKTSIVFGYKVNFTNYIGSVDYGSDGRVIGARAATHIWVSIVDKSAVEKGDFIVDQGSGENVDSAGYNWEASWVQMVLNNTHSESLKLYARAASSFGSVSDESIWGDVKWLAVGFALMTVFVNMTLGRRNLVEQRPMLAFLGLASVAQSVGISYGLCSVFGIPYCPINSILPILLMGLGVDDMFVIISAWEAAGPGDLRERAGKTMRHAGVAITVTSLTDVTAFAVGASTDLPALRSFCIYAAVGIFAVYIMQATFFLAWLVKDQKRLEEKRNGFIWTYKHENWTPSSCSQVDLMRQAFKHGFCPFILSTPMRVLVIFSTGFLLASCIWGTLNLRQEFNPMWFIPSSSYLYEAFTATTKHFPEAGEQGYIYFSNVSLPDDIPVLNQFAHNLLDSRVVTSVDAWFTAFQDYMTLMPGYNATLTNTIVQDILSIFLQSSSGASYRGDFTINGKLDCYRPAPPVTSFRIGITHRPAVTPAEQATALMTIKNLLNDVPVQGYKAAWAQAYSIWETNEIVGYELWRNIALAGVVVAVVTLVLLASLSAAFLVMVCVGATVLGVTASMWLWGLTIDTVSCIAIVLAIGLSVDYAAHICHGFLAARGLKCKRERAQVALENAGSAVLQGGLSTLLSFILLASSSSHVFITFFKIFTAASILGLYYGLIFLPVVLSIVGPEAYADHDTRTEVDVSAEGTANPAFTPDVVVIKDASPV